MSHTVKEFLWAGWAPLMAINAVWTWQLGEMPGYWAFTLCWMAAGYVYKSVRVAALEQS